MKNNIKNFNNEEALIAITSFPSKKGFDAVGWHSNKTLSQLSEVKKIIVCAEDIRPKKISFINKNLVIVGAWKKSNIFSFIPLLSFILKQHKITSILVQFEFNVFGGTIPNLCLLIMLFLLRLLGKNITFELHQVIQDVGALEKHINIKNYFLKKFLNLGLIFYYWTIGIVSSHIIVFEQELKDRLKNLMPLKKIEVLPIGVEQKILVAKNKAKDIINVSKNKFILLVFGFINGYKGIDWLLKSNPILKNKNITLLIAGGKNPYLKDKFHYKSFYADIVKEAKKYSNVIHAGFIPDNKVSSYFAASDLVIMPYEVFMSASGPFSLTLEHKRPIILSQVLSDYQKSADFKKAMEISNLKSEELFFKLNKHNLSYLVNKAITNKNYYTKLSRFTEILSDRRSISHFTSKLYSLVSGKKEKNMYAINKNFNVQI